MRRFPRIPPRRDVLIAAAVVAAGQFEVWLTSGVHPRTVAAPAELVLGLVLAWRRLFPLWTIAIVSIAGAAETLGGVPMQSPAVPLLANVIAIYAVVTQEPPRRALAGLGIGLVGFAIGVFGSHNSLGNFVFGAIFAVGVWIVGRTVRVRTATASELEARATTLEREREEQARRAAAEERARIARELHDVIAHSVSVMVVQAGAGEEVLQRDPERAADVLRSIQETGRQALSEMSRLLGILREHGDELGLVPQPGIADLGSLLEQTRQAGLPVEFTVQGEERSLPRGVEVSLYRIVQEALTNTRKHAGPACATLLLRYSSAEVTADIADDGAGSRNGYGGGNGVIGMRERVAVYGGSLEAGPQPGGGYLVHARIPLEPVRQCAF
jgi:signal transduction histidine kinase